MRVHSRRWSSSVAMDYGLGEVSSRCHQPATNTMTVVSPVATGTGRARPAGTERIQARTVTKPPAATTAVIFAVGVRSIPLLSDYRPSFGSGVQPSCLAAFWKFALSCAPLGVEGWPL